MASSEQGFSFGGTPQKQEEEEEEKLLVQWVCVVCLAFCNQGEEKRDKVTGKLSACPTNNFVYTQFSWKPFW